MDWIITLICSYLAAFFFGLSTNAPKKTRYIAALVGAVGYCIYKLIEPSSIQLSAFVATFFCCISSELLARVLKTSTTGLTIIALIPLVPGVMLYKTMLRFGEGNTLEGIEALSNTLIYAGMMAIGVTLATLIGRFVITPLYNSVKNRKQCDEMIKKTF